MPRPPPKRAGPIQRRTRTGCQTCRARKVKCDEGKPRCQRCIAKGVPCDRNVPLKWETDYSSRGLAFGRQGKYPKSRASHASQAPSPNPGLILHKSDRLLHVPTIRPDHFVNLTIYDFANDPFCAQTCVEEDLVSTQQIVTSPGPAFSLISLSRPISPYPTLQGFELGLFEYYLCRLCPLTTPATCTISPFVKLIAPLFSSGGQEYVVLSVMALAARHRGLIEAKWSRVATSLKGKVLATLQKRIKSSKAPMDVLSDSQIPVTMLFLCLEEILDSCDHRWVIHMRAGQDFIRRRKQLLPPSSHNHQSDQLVSFAEHFFAYQDVISRTACGDAPLFGLEYWQTPIHSPDRDTWTACRPAITAIIFRITELARARERNHISRDQFEKEAETLEDELLLNGAGDANLEFSDSLRRCERLKRMSAELYFYCLLKDATPATPQVARLAKVILEEISQLVTSGCVAGLVFPLFTAAVELDPLNDEEDLLNAATGEMVSGRRLVVEILSAMTGSALCNVSRTGAVIRKVWRMRDLHLNDDFETSQKNDWSTHVNPYSLNISLA